MSRMIPPFLSLDLKSSGERKIFNRFLADNKSENWAVLHSLNLSKHINQIFGEIDFLVLAPKYGIFCLEVKSGNVMCREGVWIYRDRFGVDHKSTKGPFNQAKDNMFSLIEWIRKRDPSHRLANLLFGYGVVFPDIEFNAGSIECDGNRVFDRTNLSIADYIINLTKLTMLDEARLGRKRNVITAGDVEELLKILRPEFEIFRSTKDILDDTEEKIDAFTEEQYKCLDALEGNARCLFNGPAGTGKTVIAVESAKRKIAQKEKVLFVCFNALLAVWLKSRFSEEERKYITVESLSSFMEKLLGNFSVENKDNYYFENILPSKAAEYATENGVNFKNLIIDEGQDLIKSPYLSFLNQVLEGGLDGGHWEIYCDMDRQSIFSNVSKYDMENLLAGWATRGYTTYKLTVNCRNTENIAKEISLICGFDTDRLLVNGIEGELPVNYKFVNKGDEVFEIEKIINYVKSKQISLNRITILSPVKFTQSTANKIGNKCTVLEKQNLFTVPEDSVTFSTIGKFKGLENSFVIITDFSAIEHGNLEKLYVAMSRAKFGLYLIMGKDAEKDYDSIMRKFSKPIH